MTPSAVAHPRVRRIVRFATRTFLIVFIIAVAVLPLPPPLLAFFLRRDPRNNVDEVGRKKKAD